MPPTAKLTLVGRRAYACPFLDMMSKRIRRPDPDGHGSFSNAMTLHNQKRFSRLDTFRVKTFTRWTPALQQILHARTSALTRHGENALITRTVALASPGYLTMQDIPTDRGAVSLKPTFS
jgi:hypothetical protein